MKAMHYSVTGDNDTDGVLSIVITVFAAIFSWQEHAEWVFRIISLICASGVSIFALWGYFTKYFPEKAKSFKNKFKRKG